MPPHTGCGVCGVIAATSGAANCFGVRKRVILRCCHCQSVYNQTLHHFIEGRLRAFSKAEHTLRDPAQGLETPTVVATAPERGLIGSALRAYTRVPASDRSVHSEESHPSVGLRPPGLPDPKRLHGGAPSTGSARQLGPPLGELQQAPAQFHAGRRA